MNCQHNSAKCTWAAGIAALFLALLASCGGGVVGSGGTGSPMGAAVGTVNGFGSVVVDGHAYDNRNAPVLAEVEPGRDIVSEVKLGHRVSVDYATAGVASVVRVDAALVGAVTSVLSPSQFSVLGQTVTVNASATTGPVTQFGGGYAQAADLRANDAVEVHGVLIRQGTSYRVQATRIDKLAAAPAYLRVTGLVSQLGTGGAVTLSLGALTVDASTATLLPAGTALANGQAVTVLALPGTLTALPGGAWRLQASQVRVRELRSGGLDDYVSGSVTGLDTLTKTFALGSLMVNYAAASVSPATPPLANSQYVRVRGMGDAAGVLVATSVTIRDGSTGSEAELKGNISGYDAVTKRFVVRGVTVDAIGTTRVEACPATGLANGLFVEIHGSLGSNGVVAQTIHCENEPSGSTVEREGNAGAVNISGMGFSLLPENGSALSVTWTATTYFGGVTPQTLSGKKVHVEGSLVGTTLVATKIKLDA